MEDTLSQILEVLLRMESLAELAISWLFGCFLLLAWCAGGITWRTMWVAFRSKELWTIAALTALIPCAHAGITVSYVSFADLGSGNACTDEVSISLHGTFYVYGPSWPYSEYCEIIGGTYSCADGSAYMTVTYGYYYHSIFTQGFLYAEPHEVIQLPHSVSSELCDCDPEEPPPPDCDPIILDLVGTPCTIGGPLGELGVYGVAYHYGCPYLTCNPAPCPDPGPEPSGPGYDCETGWYLDTNLAGCEQWYCDNPPEEPPPDPDHPQCLDEVEGVPNWRRPDFYGDDVPDWIDAEEGQECQCRNGDDGAYVLDDSGDCPRLYCQCECEGEDCQDCWDKIQRRVDKIRQRLAEILTGGVPPVGPDGITSPVWEIWIGDDTRQGVDIFRFSFDWTDATASGVVDGVDYIGQDGTTWIDQNVRQTIRVFLLVVMSVWYLRLLISLIRV